MEGIIIYIIAIVAFIFGWLLAVLMINKAPRGEQISIMVTSTSTGEQYMADHYYIDKDGTPILRIWNQYTGSYKWYPIWQFKQPLMVMAQIDPEYTKANIGKLVGLQGVAQWRKDKNPRIEIDKED